LAGVSLGTGAGRVAVAGTSVALAGGGVALAGAAALGVSVPGCGVGGTCVAGCGPNTVQALRSTALTSATLTNNRLAPFMANLLLPIHC
jgi:hypothetical protein